MYHLAKFVDVTRQKLKKDLIKKFNSAGIKYTPEQLHKLVEDGVKDDIRRGIQTLQYQILTLMTTNGKLKRSGRLAQGYASEKDGEPRNLGCLISKIRLTVKVNIRLIPC